ncbi:MAG: redox-regulated ATPase YchF [Desulfobacterales bacterium]|nr:redox-regulated ATPase YchF [Desulfobacterales bacterium]
MKIGLIGPPNSGKTTIFNALTKAEAPVTGYANCKAKPNLAVVDVVDDRVTCLSKMYKPQKTVYATIELIDFVGLSQGSASEGIFAGTSMALIKNADALALVVRNFPDDSGEPPMPLKDIETIQDELLISDMIVAENRLERIEHAYKRGKKTNALEAEEKTLRNIVEHLSADRPVRDLDLDGEQEKMMRGFQFLTQKPFMIILNSGEIHFMKNQQILTEIEKKNRVVEFAGKFEMELSRLIDRQDVKLFMADMGIQESARQRLTRLAYETLGYVSFFTVGSDEVRAWSVVNGSPVVKAAETIHADLARGFIRAECFSCDDLMNCGSEKGVREKGRVHLEGKEYIVRDGDIVNIRFHV